MINVDRLKPDVFGQASLKTDVGLLKSFSGTFLSTPLSHSTEQLFISIILLNKPY